MKRIWTISLLIISGCGSTYHVKKGDTAMDNLAYHEAVEEYEHALKKSENENTHLKLADAYMKMNKIVKAEEHYTKVMYRNDLEPIHYFNYAKVEMILTNYPEARRFFGTYLSKVPSDVVARMLLASCNSVSQFYQDTTLFTLKKLELDKVDEAFGSTPYKDGIVFTGSTKEKKHKKQSPWTGMSYLDLYFTQQDEKGNWISPTLLKGEINGEYHEGPATFNKEGNVVYFTRSNYMKHKMKKNAENMNNLKIFRAELKDDKWTNVTELPFNSDDYSCGHPCLSADGNSLYFVSDMPKGNGGTDIYRIEFKDGQWSDPENLGDAVNTPGNEMFPYYHEDGSLYFSSDAHHSLGGLDVFVTSYDGKKWLQPENLNYPVNSTRDDFAFTMNPDNESGFLTSTRTDKDQLYQFKRHDPTFNLTVTVLNKATGKPIEDAWVAYYSTRSDSKQTVKTNAKGQFKMRVEPETELSLGAGKDGFFSQYAHDAVSTKGKKISEELAYSFKLTEMVIEKPIVLENIYYDYDKWEIRPDAAKELDVLVKTLKDNPKISIEMGSHTDSRAGDRYNLILSDKRAKAAVDYLISKGIDPKRLKWKGYGESRLVNKCKNNVECTEEEHQQNRRTEFKVIKIEK